MQQLYGVYLLYLFVFVWEVHLDHVHKWYERSCNGFRLYVYLTASNLQNSHIHSCYSRSSVPLLQSGLREARLSYPFVMLYLQIVCYFCVKNRLVTFHGVGRFVAGLWPVSNTQWWLLMMHYRMQGTRMCVCYMSDVTCYMSYVTCYMSYDIQCVLRSCSWQHWAYRCCLYYHLTAAVAAIAAVASLECSW